MGSVKYFTPIDIWQCYIADEGIPKTAFFIRYNLYKWVFMPMGLTNIPATFMQTMNKLFCDLLDSGMAVFLDNILIYLCII